MISSAIPDILAIIMSIVTIIIAVRAFYLYTHVRSPRLFILGLAMGLITLTALADLASGHITSVTLNTNWFLYVGQAVSFLFIFLSLVNSDEGYQQGMMRWHIICSLLAVILLILSPVIPDFPNMAVKFALRGTRTVLCFAIFFSYTAAFMSKQTRFSFLMGTAFLMLSFGYLLIILQYAVTPAELFDNLGDIVRMVGLIALLTAVTVG
jgi:hypothetical protein